MSWNGSSWHLGLVYGEPFRIIQVDHVSPKLFGGLHELDDKYRAALAAADPGPEVKS